MKSRWLILVLAAFLVVLGSPMGIWACQKAVNTTQSENDEMGLASSEGQYGYEEMAPANPQGEDQYDFDGMTPSSPGLDEGRDELTPSSPNLNHEDRDEMTPSSPGTTDDWRDEMTPSSPGVDDSHNDELTPAGSGSDDFSDRGRSTDEGSEIYYP